MELSLQETALILPQREARKNATAAALAGGLADFLQVVRARAANADIDDIGAQLNSKSFRLRGEHP
jgi:hypothetical protein